MIRKWHIEYMGYWHCEDVECSECETFRMWNAREVECSACGIFGMCDVRDVKCQACGMLRIRDVEDVPCLGCRIFKLWDVRVWDVYLQNVAMKRIPKNMCLRVINISDCLVYANPCNNGGT